MDVGWPPFKKRRITTNQSNKSKPDDDDDDEPSSMPALPFLFPKLGASTHLYNTMNHIYFNDDINEETAFSLNRDLRAVKLRLSLFAVAHGIPTDTTPIVLHITTNGGCIHSAFSIVDCITTLGVPVHTIVEGFVASAGTLVSMSGAKRSIMPNAYMLLHEVRSGVWGKMSAIEEEIDNLRKLMNHITAYYVDRSHLTKTALKKILVKDTLWSAAECVSHGIVDGMFQN